MKVVLSCQLHGWFLGHTPAGRWLMGHTVTATLNGA
jgi:hypothetical protein